MEYLFVTYKGDEAHERFACYDTPERAIKSASNQSYTHKVCVAVFAPHELYPFSVQGVRYRPHDLQLLRAPRPRRSYTVTRPLPEGRVRRSYRGPNATG